MFKFIKNLLGIKTIIFANYEKSIMTVHYDDGSFDKYHGECTVWHKLPLMERCGTYKESELCDIWQYIKFYGNDYPTAHYV